MKAAQINGYGDVTAIQIRDIEKPTVNNNQVLVKVGAASLNPFDQAVLAGFVNTIAPLNFPAILGQDFAGTIIEVGDDVNSFTVGDRVFGTANAMFGGSGAFAEFTAADASTIARTPDELSDTEAASLPTAAVSAQQAINTMNIQKGQKVFIDGGSGGVGSIAIEITKSLGAYVATTVSAANSDYVKALGADVVIDYKNQQYADILSNYDALLTNVRSDKINNLLPTLKKSGIAVSLVGPFDEERAKKLGITTSVQLTHITTKSLNELSQLIIGGVLHATIDKVFSLDQTRDAYKTFANESIKGKAVISVHNF